MWCCLWERKETNFIPGVILCIYECSFSNLFSPGSTGLVGSVLEPRACMALGLTIIQNG
jgi:hypothetical protein